MEQHIHQEKTTRVQSLFEVNIKNHSLRLTTSLSRILYTDNHNFYNS